MSNALDKISSELAKQGKFELALLYAAGISLENMKSRALREISTELLQQNNFPLAEKTALEIPLMAERHECWKEMASAVKEKEGLQKALQQEEKLQHEEARLFYLKGWAENMDILEADAATIQQALPYFLEDPSSLEKLMQAYGVHQIFFGEADPPHLQRLGRTLGLQWALDIAARFPPDSPPASSAN